MFGLSKNITKILQIAFILFNLSVAAYCGYIIFRINNQKSSVLAVDVEERNIEKPETIVNQETSSRAEIHPPGTEDGIPIAVESLHTDQDQLETNNKSGEAEIVPNEDIKEQKDYNVIVPPKKNVTEYIKLQNILFEKMLHYFIMQAIDRILIYGTLSNALEMDDYIRESFFKLIMEDYTFKNAKQDFCMVHNLPVNKKTPEIRHNEKELLAILDYEYKVIFLKVSKAVINNFRKLHDDRLI